MWFDTWPFLVIWAAGWLLSLAFTKQANVWHWQTARWTSRLALLFALVHGGYAVAQWWQGTTATPDWLGTIVTLLVGLLGWVVIKFAEHYLAGEPRQPRFVKATLFTLAAVALMIVSDSLLLMLVGWSLTSVGLHSLLLYYPERRAAQIVAHKKFIASRFADVLLATALALVFIELGSFSMSDLNALLDTREGKPATLDLAVVLIAVAAVVKTAQLPIHGWLIQVMEAPTPVSALLHAGVINLSGLVLLRLADALTFNFVAQATLVIVGSLTAALAAMVMLTRISIKVRLAWSTCAQMGFMLMEIGLGLYELALLHLVAHSLYKAHAFLSSGEAVLQARLHSFARANYEAGALWVYLASPLVSAAVVAGSLWLWQQLLPGFEVTAAVLVILTIGFAPLYWPSTKDKYGHWLRGAMRSFVLTQLYFLWHLAFAQVMPPQTTTSWFLLGWVTVVFIGLYATQLVVQRYPQGTPSRRLFPWAYNGFYLDERFTRMTFKVWPLQFKQPADLDDGETLATETMK